MAKKTVTTRINEPKKGKCLDCKNAYLMQSLPCNPIVSECTITKERWVASMEPDCGRFEHRKAEAVIHPMIYLNRH